MSRRRTEKHVTLRWSLSVLAGLTAGALLVPGTAAAQEGPARPCAANAECDATGLTAACVDGFCVSATPLGMECASDAECGDPGAWCLEGECWAVEGATEPVDPEPDPDAMPCEEDVDCPEDYTCQYGDCATGEMATCRSDADCGRGGTCMDGICVGGSAGMCSVDADCGSGEICVACACMPGEDTCRSDDECPAGQRCDLMGIASAGSAGGGDPTESCTGEIGYCGLDPTQIPTNPQCEPFCTALGDCQDTSVSTNTGSGSTEGSAGEGTDTAEQKLSEEEMAECLGFCSYLLEDPEAAAATLALVDCVAANAAAGCDTIMSACQDEAETVGVAADDVPAGAYEASSDGTGGTTGGTPQSGSVGDTFRRAFGEEGGSGNGNGAGPDAGVGGGGTGDGSSDSGGCQIGSGRAPMSLALFGLTLLGLGVARRRRRD